MFIFSLSTHHTHTLTRITCCVVIEPECNAILMVIHCHLIVENKLWLHLIDFNLFDGIRLYFYEWYWNVCACSLLFVLLGVGRKVFARTKKKVTKYCCCGIERNVIYFVTFLFVGYVRHNFSFSPLWLLPESAIDTHIFIHWLYDEVCIYSARVNEKITLEQSYLSMVVRMTNRRLRVFCYSEHITTTKIRDDKIN